MVHKVILLIWNYHSSFHVDLLYWRMIKSVWMRKFKWWFAVILFAGLSLCEINARSLKICVTACEIYLSSTTLPFLPCLSIDNGVTLMSFSTLSPTFLFSLHSIVAISILLVMGTCQQQCGENRIKWQLPNHRKTVISFFVPMYIDDISINGLVWDCSNSIVNVLKLLQSCTKPSIFWYMLLPLYYSMSNFHLSNCS